MSTIDTAALAATITVTDETGAATDSGATLRNLRVTAPGLANVFPSVSIEEYETADGSYHHLATTSHVRDDATVSAYVVDGTRPFVNLRFDGAVRDHDGDTVAVARTFVTVDQARALRDAIDAALLPIDFPMLPGLVQA